MQSTVKLWAILLMILTITACTSGAEDPGMRVVLVADGRELTFQISESMTVEDFLQEAEVEVEVGVDRLNPPLFSQLNDGMRITVVRIDEETECIEEPIPYEQEIILNEGLAPDEQRVIQAGENGIQQTCYRIILADGTPQERQLAGPPTVLKAPVNELVTVGVDREIEPVAINGTLAYVSNGNAWVISGSSTSKRRLTNTSDLDSLVFSLSADGRYLLFTRESEDDAFVNELWFIETDVNSEPIQLTTTDVLYAEWVPFEEYTISYTTGEPQPSAPFWRSLNNLWTARIDPNSGRALNPRQIVPESSGGLDGWWGTIYRWSPDGSRIAYVQADEIGIIDPESDERIPLMQYALYRTVQPWSWRSGVSWSWDGTLITAAVHGPPVGREAPESSPRFDVAIAHIDDLFDATINENTGMWSGPKFSPKLNTPDSEFEQGYLAYLRAREPFNSVNGQYDLIVSDLDGSNARRIFPPDGQTGITSSDRGLSPQDFVWSPDGRQIGVIYQGNLYVVDVESRVATQLTFDGGAQHPVWT